MRRLHHVFIASRVEKAGRDQNYGLVAGVLGRLALHDARHRRPALAAVPANLAARSDLGAAQPDCRSLIATGSFPRPIEPSTMSVTSVGMVAPACRPLPRAAMPHARAVLEAWRRDCNAQAIALALGLVHATGLCRFACKHPVRNGTGLLCSLGAPRPVPLRQPVHSTHGRMKVGDHVYRPPVG